MCPVLVGRETTLDSVCTLLDRVRENHGGILLIAGEAGIGKSRLLRETAAEARARDFVVLKGACFAADRSAPYAPLLDLLREYTVTTSASVAAHVFAPAAAELVRAFPELAATFPDLPPLDALDPEHERRRLFHAVAETIARLSRTQPVLLAIEDIHWADEASLDLLLHLARRTPPQRVVLALSYRSDEVGPSLERLLAELDRTRIVSEFTLARFSPAELSDMLAAIFDGAPPGGEFVPTMHALTEGNPFFVEEVLKALVNAGDVGRRADGTWHARPLARIQVPRTAVDAVRRRLSALSVPARDLASIAAVVGRRFDYGLLQSLTGHDERALLALIRELLTAQLVAEESPDRFAFRHALTREAIVGELLLRERAAMHLAVADALEVQAGPPEATIEALAYHAHAARDWPRALVASTHASRHALALHAPREALAHLDRALDAAEQGGIAPDASLRLMRGRALETLGDLPGADTEFTAALNAARAEGRDADAWDALHALGLLWAARDYARAGAYRAHALDLARAIGDPSLVARSLNRVANWHVNLDRPMLAMPDHEEALALFERSGDAQGVAETVDLLAMAHLVAGNLASSAVLYGRAVGLHESLGDRRGLASALGLLCLLDGSLHVSSAAIGRSALATEVVRTERPLTLAREIGWRAGQALVLYVLADVLAWHGRYDRALPYVHESLAIAAEMDHLQWECGAARVLGTIMLDLESPSRARAPLERAHAIASRLGSHLWQRWSAAPLAVALARLGEFDAAHAVLDDASLPSPIGRGARGEAEDSTPTLGERYLALSRAEVLLEADRPQEALEIATTRLAAEQGAVPRFSLVRARALVALGHYDAAEAALRDAHRDAEALDAPGILWRVHTTVGMVMRARRRRIEARQSFAAARVIAAEIAHRIDDPELRATFERQVNLLAPSSPTPTARQKAKISFGGLTARERDVARLVAKGTTNRAIARTLGIGERTAEGYVAGALAKLGFSTRAQLAAWTVQRGLDTSGSTGDVSH